MADIALEEEQEKIYDDVIGNFTFTAEGGGAPEVQGPEITTLKPGIRLHFLRYGLFYKKSPNDVTASINKPTSTNTETGKKAYTIGDVKAQHSDIPSLENFYVARTSLNLGYIYLFNADDPEGPDCHEFEVQEDGSFSTILWRNNKDVNGRYLDHRTSEGDRHRFKVISKEKTFWFAFSTVQWTEEYLQETRKNPEKTEARMQKVECRGIKKEGDNHKHAISYKDLYTVHYQKHVGHGVLKEIIHNIEADEKRQDEEDDENVIYDDMFVTLDDPIGCVNDISQVVNDKTIRFKALVDAIQSGETLDQAYERLNNGSLEAPMPEKEYQELFTLALTCYQLVYNDNDAILKYDGGSPGFNFSDRHSLDPRPAKKWIMTNHSTRQIDNTSRIGYGLDHQKLEGILGIKERNEAREDLIRYRDELGNFVSNNYFRKHLDDYLCNHDERKLEGRGLLMEILDVLSYHPYKFDQHLILKKDYVEKDKWVDWIYNITDDACREDIKSEEVKSNASGYEGMDPLYALLGAPLNLNAFLGNAESFSKKLASVYKKNLKHRASFIAGIKEIDGKFYKTIPEKQVFIVDKLNKNLKVFGHEMFEIRDGDIWMRLDKLGVELDPEYNPLGKYTGKRADVLRIIKDTHPDGFEYRRIRKGRYVDYEVKVRVRENMGAWETLDPKTQRNIKISKVINGRAFNGVFAALELYNFGNAIITVTEEGSTRKDEIYALGSAIKLGDASMNLAKTVVSTSTANKAWFRTTATSLSVVGGVITAGWCFYDSYSAIDKGDMDAGLALIGAGVAFGVSALASLGTIAALGGPVGWIMAAIGLGLLIIASLLTDSELETYFKNFVLSDRVAFPKPDSMLPMRYILKVLDERENLTKDSYHETLMNPYDAQAKLFDYIICKEIEFKPIDPEKISFTSREPGSSITITSSLTTAYRFNAKMVFSRFFNHPDQVEVYAFFYAEGIKKGNPKNMVLKKPEKVYDNDNMEALQVQFSVSSNERNQIKMQSEVVFALRLKVDESKKLYFPYHLGGKERFLGSKIRLRGLSAGLYISDLHQNEEVNIAPLNELKNRNAW
ncbi:toxin VasX [Spongiivirga citrea]|uniref:Toxin VasX N-terminal region domain-containing protein n=1 Tax=Spongiivirga citrea TaxID=1481457 RepID=A0A6M0CR24_9FLAO|nr:toxin VasX [Spongiivirga citrea]NER18524.1 hypothetical protein [Spongiivirga citrea]